MNIELFSTNSDLLHERFGLTEDRVDEIVLIIKKARRHYPHSKTQTMKEIAEACTTNNEFAYALFTYGFNAGLKDSPAESIGKSENFQVEMLGGEHVSKIPKEIRMEILKKLKEKLGYDLTNLKPEDEDRVNDILRNTLSKDEDTEGKD